MRLSLCCCVFLKNEELDRMAVEDKRMTKVFVSHVNATVGHCIIRLSSYRTSSWKEVAFRNWHSKKAFCPILKEVDRLFSSVFQLYLSSVSDCFNLFQLAFFSRHEEKVSWNKKHFYFLPIFSGMFFLW